MTNNTLAAKLTLVGTVEHIKAGTIGCNKKNYSFYSKILGLNNAMSNRLRFLG
jgi:hypothetical protein